MIYAETVELVKILILNMHVNAMIGRDVYCRPCGASTS
jgi:hypothetical protein